MSGHTYAASLAEHPLPEILQTLCDYAVPGVLRCAGAGGEWTLRFSGGRLTELTAPAGAPGLADWLAARGSLTAEQLAKARQWVAEGHGEEGAVLVAIGALSPGGLDLARQTRMVESAVALFDWTSGTATVDLGQPGGETLPGAGVDIRRLILDGVRGMADAKRALGAVGGRDTVLEPAEDAFQRLGELNLAREEMRLVRLIDGERNFYDVVQAGVQGGMPQAAAVKLVYALVVLQVIRKKAGAVRMRV